MKQLLHQSFKFLQSVKKLKEKNDKIPHTSRYFKLKNVNSVSIYFHFENYENMQHLIDKAKTIFANKTIHFLMFKKEIAKTEVFTIPVYSQNNISIGYEPKSSVISAFHQQSSDLFISLISAEQFDYKDAVIATNNTSKFRAGLYNEFTFCFEFMLQTSEKNILKNFDLLLNKLEIINT